MFLTFGGVVVVVVAAVVMVVGSCVSKALIILDMIHLLLKQNCGKFAIKCTHNGSLDALA
jgi:hypothetical protein